jgi:hypothetical protein
MELEHFHSKGSDAENSSGGISLSSVIDLNEISFQANSYWGSTSYHSGIPKPTHSLLKPSERESTSSISLIPRYSDRITSKWLVGDLVYVPLSIWFEPDKLYALPIASQAYLQAHVLKRTAKQVTLFFPALRKDFVRGFAFMEVHSHTCHNLIYSPENSTRSRQRFDCFDTTSRGRQSGKKFENKEITKLC